MRSHLWGDIAASNGNVSGDVLRDAVAIKMTPSQIAKHKTLPVNVSVRNTKGVETISPIDFGQYLARLISIYLGSGCIFLGGGMFCHFLDHSNG